MKNLMLTLLTLLFTSNVYAQTTQNITSTCRLVAAHVQQDGVEHVGDSEVPADLNPLNGGLGTVQIPITIDLAARFGIDVPLGAELQPDVAVISVRPNGKVLYNGQDLSGNVATVCGQMNVTDGQATADALGSTPEQ